MISEIKAEMGRRDLTNSALASLIGESKQYVGSRLGAGNPHTGKRVEINVADLYAIAGALDLSPRILLDRAAAVADGAAVLPLRKPSEEIRKVRRPKVAKRSQEPAGAPEDEG